MIQAEQMQGIGMTSLRTRKRLVQRLRDNGIANPRVLDAIQEVPRHLFVDEALSHRAYEDTALPIGFQQTLSQPWIVARMTELLLEIGTIGKVLEVGTGSGYQAAVLARFAGSVYSVERIRALLTRAQQRFRRLGLRNVEASLSDGGWGLASQAPFDGIVLTAAPETLPDGLLEQLRIGGRLVAPIGPDGNQYLWVYDRTAEGFTSKKLDRVRFVPLLSGVVAV